MTKLTCFFSPKYHEKITHLAENGKREYFLDTIIKPKWVCEAAKSTVGIVCKEPSHFVTENDVLQVHSNEYLASLKSGSPHVLSNSSGIRWVPELLEATFSSVSGYYSAAHLSLENHISGSLSTNFHHAKRDHGSGFCVLNGTAITAKKLISENKVTRILILDCDFHYGDGNAEIFQNDKNVSIFDIYGGLHSIETSVVKAPNLISYQVDNTEDYFSKLSEFREILNTVNPEIVLYDAGMDVWDKSRIGKINGMNIENIRRRESFVFQVCKEKNIPVAFILSGGYVRYREENGDSLFQEEVESNRMELAQVHLITLEEGYKNISKYRTNI